MSRPKRNLLATARDTMSPPDVLAPGHVLAQVVKAEGKNLFSVKEHNQDRALLVELPSRFRSQIWIKRNGYVVVNKEAFGERENKLDGEIVNIVRDEKQWRKQAYWPAGFKKESAFPQDSDEDESTMGELPPPSSEKSEDEDE